jgi:hypothetical protein
MLLLLKSKQINLTFLLCLGRQKVRNERFYCLEVVMSGNLDPCSKEHLGTEYEIASILKPSAPVGNVTEKLGNLGNKLTK